jgi:hypothetical protein
VSPNAGPGEKKFPDDVLAKVEVTPEAKALAADLQNEARTERIYAIIQTYLDRRCCL